VANFDAHTMHCERHFFRCLPCNSVIAYQAKAEHLAHWTDPLRAWQAAEDGDLELLRTLRAHGTVLESALSSSRDTLLHVAARKGSAELLAVALGHAASRSWLSALNDEGNSALHLAVVSGFEAVGVLLLESRADPDQKTSSGEAPIILACRHGEVSLLRRLIEADACLDARTALGDSALQAAQSRGHLECVLALSQMGGGRNRLQVPRPPSNRSGMSGTGSPPPTAQVSRRASPLQG